MLPPTNYSKQKAVMRSQAAEGPERRAGRAGDEAPEEARLVHYVVLLHHSPPVSLELLYPPLLGLRRLDVPLLQVPDDPDIRQ